MMNEIPQVNQNAQPLNMEKVSVNKVNHLYSVLIAVLSLLVGLGLGYFLFVKMNVLNINEDVNNDNNAGNDIKTESVKIYKNTEDTDPGTINCNALGYDTKDVSYTDGENVIEKTLELLIDTMVYEENGNDVEKAEALKIDSLELSNGILTIKLDDPKSYTFGGSCRINIIKERFVQTAKQFEDVNDVEIESADGGYLFQP